jgi:hypothetical protein
MHIFYIDWHETGLCCFVFMHIENLLIHIILYIHFINC